MIPLRRFRQIRRLPAEGVSSRGSFRSGTPKLVTLSPPESSFISPRPSPSNNLADFRCRSQRGERMSAPGSETTHKVGSFFELRFSRPKVGRLLLFCSLIQLTSIQSNLLTCSGPYGSTTEATESIFQAASVSCRVHLLPVVSHCKWANHQCPILPDKPLTIIGNQFLILAVVRRFSRLVIVRRWRVVVFGVPICQGFHQPPPDCGGRGRVCPGYWSCQRRAS